MILIAYDGTADADHAIAVAASLVHGGRAHILHVWVPLATPQDGLALAPAWTPAGLPIDDELEVQERRALDIAQAGAQLARAAGFDADAEAVRSDGSPAQALEAEIDRRRPDLVVLGSRGLTGLKTLLSGSVSRHVGSHAHAPVLIVPPHRAAA